MKKTGQYGFRLPERDAENYRDDTADINDLAYNWENADSVLAAQAGQIGQGAGNLQAHRSAGPMDHPDGSVTDAKLGNREILGTGGSLQALLNRIGTAFKQVSGEEDWNAVPAATLRGLAALEGNVLKKDNTLAFIPTGQYQPATKKYVDDRVFDAANADMLKGEFAQNGAYGVVDAAAGWSEERQFALGGALSGHTGLDGRANVLLEAAVDGGTY